MKQDMGVPPSGSGCQPSASAADASSQSGIPNALRPMHEAPRDRPIVAYCVHKSDPYFLGPGLLTPYGTHVESLGHVDDGWHVLEWGGGDSDYDEWSGRHWELPDWWFRSGSEFEEAAAPIGWLDLPVIAASAIEARSDETRSGSARQGESAGPKGDAQ